MNKKYYVSNKTWRREFEFVNTSPFSETPWLRPQPGKYKIDIFLGYHHEYNKAPGEGVMVCCKRLERQGREWSPREDCNNCGTNYNDYRNREHYVYLFWETCAEFRWLLPYISPESHPISDTLKYILSEFVQDFRWKIDGTTIRTKKDCGKLAFPIH